MFFTYKDCVSASGIQFKNLLHIGAYQGEEIEEYNQCGVESIVWFDANSDYEHALKQNTSKYGSIAQQYFFEALSDVNDEKVVFNITNNGQSSSILPLGSHLSYCPSIQVIDAREVCTKRFDHFEDKIDLKKIDFVVLDVQGAELKVLKGFGDIFSKYPNIKGIFTETNYEEVYIGAPHIVHLEEFLNNFGFERILNHKFEGFPWGDAFYLRK